MSTSRCRVGSWVSNSGRIDEPYAWAGTQNAELDRLLDRLAVETDREVAAPLWDEYQEALIEEQPYTFFYFSERLDGWNRRLHDVVMDQRGEWVNVREWYIDPASR